MMHTTDGESGPLAAALFRLMHSVKSAKHDDPVDRSAIIILARLAEHGALRLSDLAGDLCLDVSTMSRHARTLEDRGYVAREGDPTDGRAIRLTIADPGRAVLATASANRQAWLEASLADWSEDERAQLTATLLRLADALTPPRARADRADRADPTYRQESHA
jgi:DNA-binding MarR family transcriptional regulator